MKTKEIREKTTSELEKTLKDSRSRLSKLYFGKVLKPLKDNQEIKKTRRLIARIAGILSEREKK